MSVADLVSSLVWESTEQNRDLLLYQKLLVNIFLDQNIDAELNLSELPLLFERRFQEKPQRFQCKLSSYLEDWTFLCSVELTPSKVVIKASPSLRKIYFSVHPSEIIVPPPDPKLIISKHFMEQFNCVICLDVLSKPVESNCCQVLCCTECARNCNLCPICRKATSWRCNLPIQRVISNMPATCEVEGCKYGTTYGELKNHQANCEFVKVKCPNPGCQSIIQRKEMTNHKSSCPHQLLVCECGVQFLRKDQPHHSCIKHCDTCGIEYDFRHELKHMHSKRHRVMLRYRYEHN